MPESVLAIRKCEREAPAAAFPTGSVFRRDDSKARAIECGEQLDRKELAPMKEAADGGGLLASLGR